MDEYKKLVVYYSYEGNTRFIAKSIAKKINADILELKPKKEMKTKGFMKYIWGGKKVILKQKPELLPLEKNPEEYDIIIIGTPVWAFTFSPAIRTFLTQKKLKNKKIAVFCCHEGSKGKTLDNMINKLTGNKIIGKNDFLNPLQNNNEKNRKKAIEWAKKLI